MATKDPTYVDPSPQIPHPSGDPLTPEASASPTAGTLSPARAAVRTAIWHIAQAAAAVGPYVKTPPSSDRRRGGRVRSDAAAVIPHVTEVLQSRPDVASPADLAAINEDVALAADLRVLDTEVTAFEGQVSDTARLTLVDAWGGMRTVYAASQQKAKKDTRLAGQIQPLGAVLRSGPRADSSQRKADAAQAHLDTTQRRVATAQTRADHAKRRADLARQAADLAAAQRGAAPAAPAPAAPAGTPTR